MAEHQETLKKGSVGSIRSFFEKHYLALLIIPFILLLLGIGQIVYQVSTTGDFLNRGISLKGGVIVTIEQPGDVLAIEEALTSAFPSADVSAKALGDNGIQNGVEVTIDIDPSSTQDFALLQSTLLKVFPDLSEEELSSNIQVITAQFSQSFFRALMRVLLLAFVFMSIVVFAYFRTPIPCLAVILAVISDMIITLAAVNFLGIKISSAGIAAFLMLIGYSVDTDILLTSNVLKNKNGSLKDRIYKAFKTGTMIVVVTLVAVVIGWYFTISDEIRQIMIIIAIGLVVDLINTWIQNVGILRYYYEKKYGAE